MSAPYASIRERLLYRTFDWVTSDLELQAWSGGVFNEAHIRVSDLAATGAHPGAKSVETPLAFIRPGGYAASDSIKLPGGNFTVGELVTFLTLSDRSDGNAADPLLILFLDDVEGMPFIANGLDYYVNPDWLFKRAWWRP